MIDIENQVFTKVVTAIKVDYPTIAAYGETVAAPAVFPAVTIEEADNHVYEKTQSSDHIENHAGLMYEINVYSNLATGKKSQCKSIMKLIDAEMSELGFTRTMSGSVKNLNDVTIYRMVSRYKGIVSTDEKIYRR